MGLDIIPWGYPFDFFKNFTEIKGAFKTKPVSGFIDFQPMLQQQGFGKGYFLLSDIFRKSDAAVFLKKGA